MSAGGLVVSLVLLVVGPAQAQYPGVGGGQQGQPPVVDLHTPTQAIDCPYQRACVNWELCFEGTINTGGVGILNVRSPKPVPAGYSGEVCQGIGNVCCFIPDDLWVDPGLTSGGIDIVGTVLPETVWNNTCTYLHHICVPNYQCTDSGDINTYGVGIINPRFKPKSECTSPDQRYAGVPGTCCKLPAPEPLLNCPTGLSCNPENDCGGPIHAGADGFCADCYLNTWTATLGVCCKGREPEPLHLCPGDQVCVTTDTCTAQGTVSAGILGLPYLPCYLDAITNIRGVCCNPPPQEPVHVCPGEGSHTCQQTSICQGSTLIDSNGSPLACYLNGGATGVCCESLAPLQFCSNDGSFFCATAGTCQGQVLKNPYGTDQECYIGSTNVAGHCCSTPLPVDSCATDGSFFCTATGNCLENIFLLDHYGEPTTCYVGGQSSVGECCQTPQPVNSCGIDNEVCVGPNECLGTTINNAYGDGLACVYNANSYGLCCAPLVPLQICSTGYSCLYAAECHGDPALLPIFPDCYVTNTDLGKCCQPKPVVEPVIIDTCSGDSVCLPEILCQGEILNKENVFKSYTETDIWAQCRLSGSGLVSPGVCCRNAQITDSPTTLPPAATQCGVRNYGLDTRIQDYDAVNYQAQFAEFPWQAIIFFTNFTFKCGASLINDRWLLTGAHCVAGYGPSDLRVRLGEWQVDSYDELGKYLDVFIKRIFYRPEDYNSGSLANDVALIQLSNPVHFQYHINAVCLPGPGQVFYGKTRCYASGWGKNAFDGGQYQVIMKKVDLPLVEKKTCENKLRKTVLGRFFRLHPSFLCAGGEQGKDACEGDGGGPLVCQDPVTGNYVVAGITAWGIGCGKADVPGVFVDVQYFRTWIDKIIHEVQVLEANEGQTGQQTGQYTK